jgi:tetratricopeptide (TPR) repeat protein
VRSKEGHFDQAVRLLTAALDAAPRSNPDAATMLTELAEALVGQQDIAGALACCKRALDLSPNDANVRLTFGNILVGLNLHDEALRQFRLARALEPNLAQARFNEGLAMLALGMWPQAWGMLEARLSIPSMNLLNLMPADVPHWRGEVELRGKTILLPR